MTDLRQQLARLSPEQRAALERRVMAAEPHGAPVIPRRPDGVAAPLSAGQERLWFLQRFDPEDASYNLHLTERLRGPLDVEALQAAVDEVVTRHEVLRTRYPVVDGRPAPVVEPDARSLIDIVPVEGGPVTEREVHARRVVDELVNRPFHLDQAPLLRAVVLRIAERDHILCLVLHHIAGDGWSLNVLARELSRCYPAHRIGVAPVPPSLSLQYADFATWQRDLFAAQQDVTGERAQQLRERLSATPPLDLPSDRPRPRFRTSRGGHVRRRLGKQQTGRIAELATGERATTFMVLLAAYQVLLARLCGQTDFSVGSPITGRDRPELQSLIGFFTNTLVLPSDVSGDPTFRELLARLRASTLAAYSDQETPLEQLISWSDPDRDTSRTPLFQVMLNVQPAKTGLLRLPEVTSEPWIPEFDHVKVDLELNVNSYADDLELELGYSSALFDRDTAERLCGHLATLIAAATTDPDLPISRLRLLSDAQRQQALHHGNDTASGYPQERLHELVIAQAARTPDAPAVFTSDEHVTYGELLRRVRTLAWRLRDAGVPPNTPVAVLLPRTADLVAATLAVLAAGCHYVPLEPRHPPARLREIIADSGAAAAFVTEGATDTLGAPRTIAVDEARADEPPAGVPEAPGTPDDLAYLIYTSGSTGKPKGVRVPHRGVVNLVADVARTLDLTPADRFLFLTSMSFDIAALEIFAPLLTGGAVVVARDSSVHAADQVGELVRSTGVTTVQAPPSVLDALLPRLPAVARVISGGEPLPDALAQRLLERAGAVWNFYGPTETTIWSCRSRVRPGERVTIGLPVANTEAYVLDGHLEPVPAGGAGELYLAGDGLAMDYHGSRALTAGRFVPDPHGHRRGGRMYRTGDRVRRGPDGALEFLGRVDDQVKVGGVRIELGEVEAALRSHPHVRRAAVVMRGHARAGCGLVGYVVWSGDTDAAEVLRAHLRERLPEAMVPAAIVPVIEFPTLASGKLDRAALPEPPGGSGAAGPSAEPPATDSEHLVAEVFAEVLGRDTVGATDDFFDLGGNSLLAVKAQAELQFTTEVQIPLRTMFTNRTVRELAAAVELLLVAELDQLSEHEAARLVGARDEET